MRHKIIALAGIGLALLMPGIGVGQANYPTPIPISPTQVSCSSTASVLATLQPGRYHLVLILQMGTTPFFIGPATVTASGAGVGFEIPGVQWTSVLLPASTTVYCITASSTATVDVLEIF